MAAVRDMLTLAGRMVTDIMSTELEDYNRKDGFVTCCHGKSQTNGVRVSLPYQWDQLEGEFWPLILFYSCLHFTACCNHTHTFVPLIATAVLQL